MNGAFSNIFNRRSLSGREIMVVFIASSGTAQETP